MQSRITRCGRLECPRADRCGWLASCAVRSDANQVACADRGCPVDPADKAVDPGPATLRLIAAWERVCGLGLVAGPRARTRVRWGMLRMGIVIFVLIILLGPRPKSLESALRAFAATMLAPSFIGRQRVLSCSGGEGGSHVSVIVYEARSDLSGTGTLTWRMSPSRAVRARRVSCAPRWQPG